MDNHKILYSAYEGFLESKAFLYHRKAINPLIDFFKSILRPVRHVYIFRRRTPDITLDTLGVALTFNQAKYIQPILDELEQSELMSVAVEGELLRGTKVLHGLYQFNLIWLYKSFKILNGLSFLDRLHLVFYYHGYYLGILEFLKNSNISRIIVANEVHPFLRFLTLAARDLNIETILIPHTLPSKIFPTIIHSKVFLRGASSLEIYRFSETTKCYVVGDPSSFRIKNKLATKQKIGIAINAIDNIPNIEKLIRRVIESDKEIFIKLHPAFKGIPLELRRYSNLVVYDLDTFLSNLRCLFSGNSAIVVDALKQGIPVYLFEDIEDNIFNFSDYSIAPKLTDELLYNILFNEYSYKIENTSFHDLVYDFGDNVKREIINILTE